LNGKLWGISSGAKAALLAADTDFYIANASSIFKVGDLIKIPGIQTNLTSTQNILGEICRVVATPATNQVTVSRNIFTSTASANTSATNGLDWMMVGDAERLGATSRIAKGTSIGNKTNYIQSFEEPWSALDLLLKTDYYGPDEMARMKDDAMTRVSDGIEKMLLYGQKLQTTESGNYLYYSGGLQYFLNTADTAEGVVAWTTGSSGTDLVNGDGTSRIWRPQGNFTWQLIEKYVERAFKWGNQTKVGLHGSGFLRVWKNAFGDRVEFTQQTTDYGLTVNSHTVNGKKIEFVHCPAMDIEDPTGMFLVDLPYISLAVINDIHPRNNIQDNDATETKGDYLADVGFMGDFLKAHSYIKDVTDIA
jgi:hypothetical protein